VVYVRVLMYETIDVCVYLSARMCTCGMYARVYLLQEYMYVGVYCMPVVCTLVMWNGGHWSLDHIS
jgi:hypothetical protein